MFAPKNILVTGSAGFIGSHYVEYLLQNNLDIKILSLDKLTYAGAQENLMAVDAKRHELIVGDIADATLVQRLLRSHEIDTIVHFAAESHVDRSIAAPQDFITTNVLGTFTLLDAAKKFWLEEAKFTTDQCRFHHISTDEVYGSLNNQDPAFTELHPYQPNSPYSASKAASDHLIRAYAHTYGLPTTLSNCSNNYGPKQHAEKFIPTVIKACLTQTPIPVYGSGLNIRDWLFVKDHVVAIDKIIRTGKIGETYHIGGLSEKTNLEIVQLICAWFDANRPQSTSHQALVTKVTDRLGHDWRYAMDITKITRELNWQPAVAFNDGLTQTIEYYLNKWNNT